MALLQFSFKITSKLQHIAETKCDVKRVDKAKSLGVIIDETLNLHKLRTKLRFLHINIRKRLPKSFT